ncbi:MAG TPA: hypothetical protein VGR71_08435, partial [Nitrospira sp.]|nr:hypothetical protein [Nitrospira sp.]
MKLTVPARVLSGQAYPSRYVSNHVLAPPAEFRQVLLQEILKTLKKWGCQASQHNAASRASEKQAIDHLTTYHRAPTDGGSPSWTRIEP